MKLCSVCDKKIEGSWCKNCHRFVKTYELSDGIHLNESHNPNNDANCTYHTTPARTNTGSGTTRTSATNTGNRAYRTTTNTGTGMTSRVTQTTAYGTSSSTAKSAKKPKTGKIVAIIVIIYVIIVIAGSLIPLIANLVEDNSRREKEKEVSTDVDVTTPEIDWPENNWASFSVAQSLLESVEPVEEETFEEDGYTYTYKYYNPDRIKRLYVACDAEHLNMEVDEFDEFLEQWFGDPDTWEVEEDSSYEYNYLVESEGYKSTYFETDRYYMGLDSLIINLDYDTASKDLHAAYFGADATVTEEEDYYEIYHAFLKEIDEEYTETKGSLRNDIDRATQEVGEYGTVYVSDEIEVYAVKDELDRIILSIYPTYEY